jgi:hypothetical protein
VKTESDIAVWQNASSDVFVSTSTLHLTTRQTQNRQKQARNRESCLIAYESAVGAAFAVVRSAKDPEEETR